MRIVKILGTQALFQLNELMEGIMFRLNQQDSVHNLKDMLLDHIFSIICIMVISKQLPFNNNNILNYHPPLYIVFIVHNKQHITV